MTGSSTVEIIHPTVRLLVIIMIWVYARVMLTLFVAVKSRGIDWNGMKKKTRSSHNNSCKLNLSAAASCFTIVCNVSVDAVRSYVQCIVAQFLVVSCFIFYTFIVVVTSLCFHSLRRLFRSFDYVAQHRTWKLYAVFRNGVHTISFRSLAFVDCFGCCVSIVFYLSPFNGSLLKMPIICEQCPRQMNNYESNSFYGHCSSTAELIHRKLPDLVWISPVDNNNQTIQIQHKSAINSMWPSRSYAQRSSFT